MNQEKIGKFIAEQRKIKKLTQHELAEKLGVSDRAVGNWENGRNMPDNSLFTSLCKELDITLNEFMSGEKIHEKEYQQKFEENIINTIGFTNKHLKNKIISLILIIFGITITLMASSIFPSESSWGSIYSIIGTIVSSLGLFLLLNNLTNKKRIILSLVYFIIFIIALFSLDYINVKLNNLPPRYSYLKESGEKITIYKAPFYKVYRINPNTKNEYYIIDTKNKYTEKTLPVVPFNRSISGIDNIIKYKNRYIGNNSNTGALINSLPLADYGYTFEIKTNELIINYHITPWYINDDKYLEQSLIYNTVSLFILIDNLENITYNFSGETYNINKLKVLESYPNFKKITENSINKQNFNKYLESKINDLNFINEIYRKLFF